MRDKPHTLGDLKTGTSCIVAQVRGRSGNRFTARRLMEMGLLPGTQVTVQRVAPLGDPIELRLRNYSLSIRRADACGIEVRDVMVETKWLGRPARAGIV